MRTIHSILVCITFGSLLAGGAPCSADPPPTGPEPTEESCLHAVSEARKLAETLPEDDGSRYFAERDLEQAMVEAGNGEFDDCLDWAAQATVEVREHRHALRPGEKLNIRPADK